MNNRFATAIYGIGKSGVEVSFLRIDGGAGQFGNGNADREALIKLGGINVQNVTVTNVELFAPQGWSCLQLFEGRMTSGGYGMCYGATVSNNFIHDAGVPYGGLWADGISMACEGTISGNTVRNVTDVGIVLFVNNVRVENNVIENTNTFAFAAISMGAYKNQQILNNTIRQGLYYAGARSKPETDHEPLLPPPCEPNCEPEDGGSFDVAIAVGRPVWSHCNGTYSDATGTVISGNALVKRSAAYPYGGYGIALARLSNVTVTGNYATYVPSGRGSGCKDQPMPDPAAAFQFMECDSCLLQPDFKPAVSLWNLLIKR